MTPRSVPRDDLIGVIIAAALLTFLAFRITQAADLTDESYYAVFIDDWLKREFGRARSGWCIRRPRF